MSRCLSVLSLLALGSTVGAAPIEFNRLATTSGVFTGDSVGGLTGMGSSQIVFGQGVGQSPPSAISFTGTTIPTQTSGVMAIGHVSFFNGVISSTSLTPNPFSFGLQLSLALANRPDGVLQGTIPLQQFASLNSSRVAGENADTLTITGNNLPTFSFIYNEWEYVVTVLGFGSATGDGSGTATVLTVNEWNFGGGLLTAPLMAQVTASPIASGQGDPEPFHNPEPLTLVVAGFLAVGGGAYVRRRRV